MSKLSSGFIALISVLISSAVLFLAVTTLNFTGYFARVNSSESEFKKTSKLLAESCANITLLKFTNDQNYLGNETIKIGEVDCSISKTENYGSNIKKLYLKTNFKSAVTFLEFTIDTSGPVPKVHSLKELARLPP